MPSSSWANCGAGPDPGWELAEPGLLSCLFPQAPNPLWGHVSVLTLRATGGLSRNQAPCPGYEVGKVEAERGYDTQWMQSLPLRWYLGCQCTPLIWANTGDLNQRTALLQYGVPLGSGHLDQGTTPVFCPPCRPDLSEGGAIKAIPGLLLR